MSLPVFLLRWLDDRVMRVAAARRADFIVGGQADPYLRRWWVISRNPVLNIYLHQFLRSDDARALHDHPWFWCSILLSGEYVEHTIRAGGIHRNQHHTRGSVRFSAPWRAHRIELFPWWLGSQDSAPPRNPADTRECAPCWTLFVTGPRLRSWGFHCPQRGWVPWQQFTAADDPGSIGKGCDA